MGKVEKRRMDWGKHKQVKLVHEVKMEVYSRDEARHTEKSDLWPWGKRWEMDEQAWQYQRNEYYYEFEERWDYVGLSRLTGGENFVSKRNQFILYALLNFQPVMRFKNRSDDFVWVFRRVSDSASKGVLDVLKSIYLGFRKVKLRRVTVVKFEIHDRSGDGVGCLEVKVGSNAAQLTNVIVAGPREWIYLIREGKIFIKNEANVASWMGGI